MGREAEWGIPDVIYSGRNKARNGSYFSHPYISELDIYIMRHFVLLIAFFLLIACTNDSIKESLGFSETDFPQVWILSEVNMGLSGEIVKAQDISLSETYVFMADGSFTKEFEDADNEGSFSGTYTLVKGDNNRRILELNYEGEINALSYCAQDNAETLRVSVDDKTLFNGYCVSFDGPALYYLRVE